MKLPAFPPDKKPLKHYTLEDFVAALASDAVLPGAGAAGGMALAIAAGCAGKAVAITRKHQNGDRALERLQQQFERIAEAALALAEHDAIQFKQQLQSDDPAAIDALLRTDCTILDTCRALDALLDQNAHLIAANMTGDWKAARALSDACMFIQLANMRELSGQK